MKKAIYICRPNLTGTAELGVVKKILSQIRALEELGFETDSIHTDEKVVLYTTKNSISTFPAFKAISQKRGLHSALSYLSRGWNGAIDFDLLLSEIDFSQYDLVYFRYYFANKSMLNFFRNLKKIHPRIKIIIEIPTFPYNQELKNFTGGFVHQLIDGYWRKKLKKNVDILVTFSNDEEIFGIPTIQISNGIDPESYKVKKVTSITTEFRMIGVGNLSPWHGYDRIIKGLADYKERYPDKISVKFFIVGTGMELNNLQKLVSDLNLNEDVFFLGSKNKSELEELYDNMHLGLGSLGVFRKNLKINSSLKHREYTAVGLPFVLATKDLDFPNETFFIQYLPEDESSLDINELVNFQFSLYKKYEADLHNQIHKYSREKLSWYIRMEQIIHRVY